MSRYMIRFKANPAAWPTDPKAVLAVVEGVVAGGNQMLAARAISEVNFISNTEGYAIVEASSADAALGVASPFFPLYSQEIHEIVPWERATAAVLGALKMAAGK